MKCQYFLCCVPTICVFALCSLSAVNLGADALSPQHQFLSEALQWRAQTDPDHVLYVLLNAKVDWPHNPPHFNEADLINSSNSHVLEEDNAANIAAYSSTFPVC